MKYAVEFKTHYMDDDGHDIETHRWICNSDTMLVKEMIDKYPKLCVKNRRDKKLFGIIGYSVEVENHILFSVYADENRIEFVKGACDDAEYFACKVEEYNKEDVYKFYNVQDETSKTYEKLPVRIQAYQTEKPVVLDTLEGRMIASVGDYIITGVKGEQYPCKPDVFEKTYREVTDNE